MRFKTDGLILTEQTIKENDKLVTVLTRSNGIIRCFVRNAKLLKGRLCTATQSLCYSRLSVYFGRDRYIIDDAEPVELFFDLRSDLEKMALAQYFCEIAMHMIPEGSEADEFLSLILNSLYMLSKGKKPDLMVKAVFEMRFMSLAGYMPDLVCCDSCKCYDEDIMHFLHNRGKLLCEKCYIGGEESTALSRGALTALRTAVFAEPKKIFAFSVSGDSLAQFADCAEKYLLMHAERNMNALEFYKRVRIQ